MHPLIILGICLVVTALICAAMLYMWITHQRETLDRRENLARLEAHRRADADDKPGRHRVVPPDSEQTQVLKRVATPEAVAATGWPTADDARQVDDSRPAMTMIGPRPYARGEAS